MNLREYVFFNQTTFRKLAELADCHPLYLGNISKGRYKPSKRLAKRIERATNGEVTAESLLNPSKDDITSVKFSIEKRDS